MINGFPEVQVFEQLNGVHPLTAWKWIMLCRSLQHIHIRAWDTQIYTLHLGEAVSGWPTDTDQQSDNR